MKNFLSLFLLVFLASCGGYNTYSEPKKDEKTAVIKAFHDGVVLTGGVHVTVEQIDGKNIDRTWVMHDELNITPGLHKLNVSVTFSGHFGDSFKTGFVSLDLDAKPGEAYQLHGKQEGTDVVAWIEDGYGKRVTSFSKGSYSINPQDAYMPTIIVK